MCFPDQNWPYLLLLKPKELGFAVIALGGVGGGTAPHPHPGTNATTTFIDSFAVAAVNLRTHSIC